MNRETILKEINSLRKVLMKKYRFSNKYIAEEVLHRNQRTLSGICSGKRVPKRIADLEYYYLKLKYFLYKN